MTDFEHLRASYVSHANAAHEIELTVAAQRSGLAGAEAIMIDVEDEMERAVDLEGGRRIQGKNAEERAAHKRQLCHDDPTWMKACMDADTLRIKLANTIADLHRAERLMRLARQEMDWLIAMAKREEVLA